MESSGENLFNPLLEIWMSCWFVTFGFAKNWSKTSFEAEYPFIMLPRSPENREVIASIALLISDEFPLKLH